MKNKKANGNSKRTEKSCTVKFDPPEKSLLLQLSPKTELQHEAYVQVCHCCRWVRFSMQQREELIRKSGTAGDQSSLKDAETTPSMPWWYGANRKSLHDGIRFLDACQSVFNENGRIPEELLADLRRGFGDDYVAELTKWTPASYDAELLAEHLTLHAKTFGKPLPDLASGEHRVVFDPSQSRQMVKKLIDERRAHMKDLLLLKNNVDPNRHAACSERTEPNSFTTAMRDLQRAVAWFKWLKRNNL